MDFSHSRQQKLLQQVFHYQVSWIGQELIWHHQNMGKIIEIIQLFYIIYMKCVDFKLKYLQPSNKIF